MHEFELGVWKGLFVHLLRILSAHSKASGYNSVNELDCRYGPNLMTPQASLILDPLPLF